MSEPDALIPESAANPNGPKTEYTMAFRPNTGDPRASEILCTLRDDGTMKFEIKDFYGVPVGAVVFTQKTWYDLFREIAMVWKVK